MIGILSLSIFMKQFPLRSRIAIAIIEQPDLPQKFFQHQNSNIRNLNRQHHHYRQQWWSKPIQVEKPQPTTEPTFLGK